MSGMSGTWGCCRTRFSSSPSSRYPGGSACSAFTADGPLWLACVHACMRAGETCGIPPSCSLPALPPCLPLCLFLPLSLGRRVPLTPRSLQDDYLNPTDFARTMNSLVPYELAGQALLLAAMMLNWLFSFSTLKFFILFIMGTHLALQGMRYVCNASECGKQASWVSLVFFDARPSVCAT